MKYRQSFSSEVSLSCGLPQGTKLGPILFIVLVNDLQFPDPLHFSWKYVDDLSVIASPRSSMQCAVDRVVEWSSQNSMILNTKKSCYLRFSLSRSDADENAFPRPVIDGTPFTLSSEAKVLGVRLSNDLRWDAHVRHKNLLEPLSRIC